MSSTKMIGKMREGAFGNHLAYDRGESGLKLPSNAATLYTKNAGTSSLEQYVNSSEEEDGSPAP